jgi:hypothetical protein
MEIANGMHPLCPECVPIVASQDQQGALARAFIALPGERRVH